MNDFRLLYASTSASFVTCAISRPKKTRYSEERIHGRVCHMPEYSVMISAIVKENDFNEHFYLPVVRDRQRLF